MVNIFKGALFQLNRQLQVYIQKHQAIMEDEDWRPAAICISSHSFEREKVLDFMGWISYKHGFGTYFHFIEGYFSKQTCDESRKVLETLISNQEHKESTLYLDTMISPSYTSAIAQIIQTPSITGMENNMVVFEYEHAHPEELNRILENVNLVRAGMFDVCILACSDFHLRANNGIHVWIRETDDKNSGFMILLGYIILAHPDWKKSEIKIFVIREDMEEANLKEELMKKIDSGRLPITLANIEIIETREGESFSSTVEEYSKHAGLTLVGFHESMIKHNPAFFKEFSNMGDMLFVNASQPKKFN